MAGQNDGFNLAEYAVTTVTVIPTATPQKRQARQKGGKFLKGPIPLAWLVAAGALPGKSLMVGVGLWFLSGLTGSREIKPTGRLWQSLSISRQAAYRSLAALEKRGLIGVKRKAGCAPVVTLCSLHENGSAERQTSQIVNDTDQEREISENE